MDPQDDYELRETQTFQIPRKPAGLSREQIRSLPQVLQPADGFSHARGTSSHSWDAPRTAGSPIPSPQPPRDPYAYHPPTRPDIVYSASDPDPPPAPAVGAVIRPVWRRHLIVWILAFLAVAFYVVTVIFAWNASLGKDADTRLLFEDPSRTILVLQVLGTSTTTLFSELVICTCEIVPRPPPVFLLCFRF
jgi:hypothetical protein